MQKGHCEVAWFRNNAVAVYTVRRNAKYDKNSSGDEIANVNFFYNIAHVEASAYAH